MFTLGGQCKLPTHGLVADGVLISSLDNLLWELIFVTSELFVHLGLVNFKARQSRWLSRFLCEHKTSLLFLC